MQLTRDHVLRRAVAAGLALMVSGALAGTSSAAARPPDAPHLPPGFSKAFKSRFVNAGGLRQHVVIGGDGPPLLLVHGWPQNWYQYRALMPALARDYTVIAVDQRGMGLTEKPKSGYDSATLAKDLVALMDTLGYERFSVVGFDTGMVISYALAADHPERVARLVVGEAPLPGVTVPRPLPLFLPGPAVPQLFHLTFNRLDGFNEQLVHGREDLFFGYIFDAEAAIKLPGYAIRYYAKGFASSRAALSGSFGFYRAWDATSAQNGKRQATKLTMPVLAIGGEDVVHGRLPGADADRRQRRARPGHPRRRPLPCRGGPSADARGADRVPRPVPRRKPRALISYLDQPRSITMQLFLIRGLVAIAWAAVFAAVSDSVTTGVTVAAGILVVIYPLIDVAASLIDARSQRGSARRLLLAGAAVSAVAAAALALAATGSVADVLAVFGVWALLSGAAQFVVALRRRAQFGNQWPMLLAGVGSVSFGIAFVIASTGTDPMLSMLAIYAAGGGIDFVVQAWLLARRRRRPAAVPA